VFPATQFLAGNVSRPKTSFHSASLPAPCRAAPIEGTGEVPSPPQELRPWYAFSFSSLLFSSSSLLPSCPNAAQKLVVIHARLVRSALGERTGSMAEISNTRTHYRQGAPRAPLRDMTAGLLFPHSAETVRANASSSFLKASLLRGFTIPSPSC